MSELIANALNPARSAVVEACAGSGKTWLLVSRLLRLLLAGAAPSEILAITFTRKAAREIEARLRLWLAELALAPDAQAMQFLQERGLSPAEAEQALPRCRALYEQVLSASPALSITTFHGWFAHLLSGAPLASGWSGMSLEESVSDVLKQAWADVAARCAREPDSQLAQSLLWLYGEIGAHNTRNVLKNFIARRAEWGAFAAQWSGGEAQAMAALLESFGVERDVLADFFSAERIAGIKEYASFLGRNTEGDKKKAAVLLAPLYVNGKSPADGFDVAAAFAALREVVLTKEGKLRQIKPSKEQAKRLSDSGEARYLSLYAELADEVLRCAAQLEDQAAARFNQHCLSVGQALLAAFDALKRARRVMDFNDLETAVDSLLSDTAMAPFVQARLDARYRHILLDEFQDTNPLQWRILRAWLDAYTAGGVQAPTVFMVGDPKQSIYRFRRAEPRLFETAAAFLQQHFEARRLANVHTRRNAGVINQVVNAVFSGPEGMAGFAAQSSERECWPGCVQVLALHATAAPESELAQVEQAQRHPLRQPRQDPEDSRRAAEAQQMAELLAQWIGRVNVGAPGHERPLAYGDVLILTRRRSVLAPFEAALRDAGIPFLSPGRGGLLDTLEAQDLLAVLGFLADASNDLALAHALRTPVFDLEDAQLQALARLAQCQSCSWWAALAVAAQAAPQIARCHRLLSDWMTAARHLPAHDLIDHMFDTGDWLPAYQGRVPHALWPGVHANLDALLALALDVDAGRYPSLTRFVDELRRLREDDDEAPGEGVIRAAAPSADEAHSQGLDRVRIMTIHGAKGLEAPLVWLIDANASPKPPEGYQAAIDWPSEAHCPRHFSMLARLKQAGALRQPLLENERLAEQREQLNLLYVAMTRAEQILVVSGIEGRSSSQGKSAYARIEAAIAACGGDEGRLGELSVSQQAPQRAPQAGLANAVLPLARLCVGEQRPWQPAQPGAQHGTALHAWLEAWFESQPLPAVAPAIEQAARRLLAEPGLARFFDASQIRRAGNETSFILPNGETGRIDRWVDDGECVWVLDYKSGRPDQALLEAYRQQVRDYCQALAAVFAQRKLRGLLVFTDGSSLAVE